MIRLEQKAIVLALVLLSVAKTQFLGLENSENQSTTESSFSTSGNVSTFCPILPRCKPDSE